MKITLYMAITADGFIATSDGNSDWVTEEDGQLFEQKILEVGCLFVGNNTFTQFYNDLYPVNGIPNIVLSKNSSNQSDDHKNVHFVDSVSSALDRLKELKLNQALLIGGGITNGAFLSEGFIDEIILSVYPLIFGKGIKLFENTKKTLNLMLLNTKELSNDVIQYHYKVIK
jgi:dihydrofolate reductase